MHYYFVYRRKKKIQKQKLSEYAESQLVYRIYHIWLGKYELKKQSSADELQIYLFREKFLKARILENWKQGINVVTFSIQLWKLNAF